MENKGSKCFLSRLRCATVGKIRCSFIGKNAFELILKKRKVNVIFLSRHRTLQMFKTSRSCFS